jgi:hypothetical protein
MNKKTGNGDYLGVGYWCYMLGDGLGSTLYVDDPGSRPFLWWTGTEEEFYTDDCSLSSALHL